MGTDTEGADIPQSLAFRGGQMCGWTCIFRRLGEMVPGIIQRLDDLG